MEVKLRTARSLVQRLAAAAAADDEEESVGAAVSEIRLLSKHDPETRAPLADAGAIPLLAARLLSDSAAASHEDAAAALLNLSISEREAVMSTPGILDALGAALRHPSSAGAAQHAAAALYSLLAVEAYRPIIGSKRPLLASLVGLLRAPGAPTRSIKDALKALFGVALYPLNRPALVELGAVPALFSLVVKVGRGGLVEDTTAVVAQVAGCAESVDAFRRVAGVRVLVDLLDPATGATARTRENAAAALLNLVMAGGEKAAGDVREVEGAEDVVRELADGGGGGGSARGKAKAEALLRALDGARDCGRRRLLDLFDESDFFSRPRTTSSSSTSISQSEASKASNY
ncbi:U-box domain-containing protein 4 [Ananas comosus]|uniref:U-box domain-containing protein 4 n=2 Tax=Ananas comosus TaxID=4615 RepID=A0A199VPP8_ANACO|nr:U-box domain-containing protein 4 [Ananas comosus]CAD1833476.1 unnamed protein product [Ananas comosus var. bracteatus]